MSHSALDSTEQVSSIALQRPSNQRDSNQSYSAEDIGERYDSEREYCTISLQGSSLTLSKTDGLHYEQMTVPPDQISEFDVLDLRK